MGRGPDISMIAKTFSSPVYSGFGNKRFIANNDIVFLK